MQLHKTTIIAAAITCNNLHGFVVRIKFRIGYSTLKSVTIYSNWHRFISRSKQFIKHSLVCCDTIHIDGRVLDHMSLYEHVLLL